MLPIIQGDARVDLQLVLLPVLICREVFWPVQYRGNLNMRLGRRFQIRQVLLLVLLTQGKRWVLRQVIRMPVKVRIRRIIGMDCPRTCEDTIDRVRVCETHLSHTLGVRYVW
jgi:hypothetical protein